MKSLMKKISFFAFAAAMTVSASGVMTTQAHAEASPLNDLEGFTTSSLTFGTNQTTAFAIGLGYSRTFMEMIQGTVRGSFSTAGSISNLTLTVGPTLDYAIDNTGIRNAIFLRLTGGINYTNLGSGSTNFAYNLALGKRFEFFSVISWDPEFSMSGIASTGSNPAYAVTPIAFSFEW